jgi:hypothetical protein
MILPTQLFMLYIEDQTCRSLTLSKREGKSGEPKKTTQSKQ